VWLLSPHVLSHPRPSWHIRPDLRPRIGHASGVVLADPSTAAADVVHVAPAPTERWRRHPADLARLVLAGTALAALLALAAVAPDAARGMAADSARLARRLPLPVREGLLGITQVGALLAPVAVAAVLAGARRWRLLLTATVASAAAAAAMAAMQSLFDRAVPAVVLRSAETTDSWLAGAKFPSGAYLAGAAAAVTVVASGSDPRWRRALWWAVAVAALLRVATAIAVPLTVAATVAIGVVVGACALVVGGAPVRRIGALELQQTLRRMGLHATSIDEVDLHADHARTLLANLADGTTAFVKATGRGERDADLLARLVRAIRVKGVDDERPGWTPEQLARHEALLTLLAARAGARVPEVLGVAVTAGGDALVVERPVPGVTLDHLPPEQLDDALLGAIWDQLDLLHRRGIAHGWFNAHHIVVAPDGGPVVTDLRWAVPAADERVRSADVAELAVSLALLVGPARAVRSALGVLDPARLAGALPLMQPLALSPPVRGQVQDRPEVLEALRDEVQSATGVEAYRLADLARITPGRLLALVGSTLLAYVVLSFASTWESIREALAASDWGYLPLLVVLMVGTFVGGALSLIGASPRPLPLLDTLEVMYAQSFLSRFTPANAGGMALRARYLQTHGADLGVAAAAVGLTSAAAGLAHVGLLALAALWAGSGGTIGFALPDASGVAVAVLVVLGVSGLGMLVPGVRRLVFGRVMPSAGRVLAELALLVRRPGRLALLLGGGVMSKATTVAAFVLAARALGVDVPVLQLAVLYLTATTVASAAPTPGGLGAVEAALVAALTGTGVDPAIAISAVLVFRLATYWLPVLPGWFALTRVRHRQLV
jgi:glycosyltransferase 2 family protein